MALGTGSATRSASLGHGQRDPHPQRLGRSLAQRDCAAAAAAAAPALAAGTPAVPLTLPDQRCRLRKRISITAPSSSGRAFAFSCATKSAWRGPAIDAGAGSITGRAGIRRRGERPVARFGPPGAVPALQPPFAPVCGGSHFHGYPPMPAVRPIAAGRSALRDRALAGSHENRLGARPPAAGAVPGRGEAVAAAAPADQLVEPGAAGIPCCAIPSSATTAYPLAAATPIPCVATDSRLPE
jgi:hypothetical protein